MDDDRRVRMQREHVSEFGERLGHREGHPPGTISWAEHLKIYEAYAEKFGSYQSAEDIARRGGFSFCEARSLLGDEPETWREK